MQFWHVFISFSVLAAIFLLWPLLRRSHYDRLEQQQTIQNDQASRSLDERIEEINEAKALGDLNDEEAEKLLANAQSERVAEETTDEDYKNWVAKGFKSRFFIICIVALVPIVTAIFYYQQGAHKDWAIHKLVTQDTPRTVAQDKELYKRLQQRTKESPNNPSTWFVLANLAVKNENIGEAIDAFREVIRLQPTSTNVMSDLAKLLMIQSGNVITPEIKKLSLNTLKIDPENNDALGMAGLASFQEDDFETAIVYWQKSLDKLSPGSAGAKTIEGVLARAKTELAKQEKNGTKKKKPLKPVPLKPIEKPEVSTIVEQGSTKEVSEKAKALKKANGAAVLVKVLLGEGVKAKPNDIVFIYARAWNGPKMPLAISRMSVSDLPVEVVLSDDNAMAPNVNLSSFDDVEIIARISRDGTAISKPGDWQATSGKLSVSKNEEQIVLTVKEQIK